MKKKKNIIFLVFAIVVSLTLLGFTIYRAVTTCITYDEAFTYMNYVYHNPFYVFSHLFKDGTWANNHLLNSFFISGFNTLFHASYNEIIIRVPNILSYLVYFIFSYLITKDNKYKFSDFSLLALNYGANEFFGLGRGYGMACALVLVGVYFFKTYLKNNKYNILLTLAYFFLLLGCYANTVALIPFGAIIVASFISLIKDKKIFSYSLKQSYLLIPIIILSLLVVKYHFMISKEGLPLYGGGTSFYQDVLVSLFNVYGFVLNNIVYVVNGVILLAIIIIVRNIKEIRSNFVVIAGLLYFVLLIAITKITGNMWITGRSLIPSMPLLIVMLQEIINTIEIKLYWVIEIVIIIPITALFIYNLNLKETREWQDNYVIRDICNEAYEKKDNSKISEYRFNEVTNFYHNKILIEKNYDIYQENPVKNTKK